jgi:hypothetical protein
VNHILNCVTRALIFQQWGQAPRHPRTKPRSELSDLVAEPSDENEAHAPGESCARCGNVIRPDEDVRRRADGRWVHETCPLSTAADEPS